MNASNNANNRWLTAVIVIAVLGVLVALSLWGGDTAPPKHTESVAQNERTGPLAAEASHGKSATSGTRELIAEQPEGTWPLVVEIVDAHGDAVAGARVTVVDAVSGEAGVTVITDRDGLSEIPIAADRAAVRGLHEEVGRTLTLPVSKDEDEGTPVRLILWRTVQMRGVVLGEDARPLRGVRVDLEAASLLYGTNSPHVAPANVVSDDLGRFTFEAPLGLHGYAHMTPPGRGARVKADWTAENGGEVVLAMPGAFRIEGLVLDADGNRAKANVALAREVKRLSMGMGDPVEQFSVDAESSGMHEIVALGFDGWTAKQKVELTVARPRAYVELKLSKEDNTLALAPIKKVFDPKASITFDVFRDDGSPAVVVDLSYGDPNSDSAFYHQQSTGNQLKVGGRSLWQRPLQMLFFDKSANQYATFDLPEGPIAPRVRIVLEQAGSIDIVARCRGRVARGVTLYLSTPHTDFASGTGKHRMQLNDVPPGPALLEARRGFELLGTKALIIRGGVINYATIEVDL